MNDSVQFALEGGLVYALFLTYVLRVYVGTSSFTSTVARFENNTSAL